MESGGVEVQSNKSEPSTCLARTVVTPKCSLRATQVWKKKKKKSPSNSFSLRDRLAVQICSLSKSQNERSVQSGGASSRASALHPANLGQT